MKIVVLHASTGAIYAPLYIHSLQLVQGGDFQKHLGTPQKIWGVKESLPSPLLPFPHRDLYFFLISSNSAVFCSLEQDRAASFSATV